jgi:hypothetical protein
MIGQAPEEVQKQIKVSGAPVTKKVTCPSKVGKSQGQGTPQIVLSKDNLLCLRLQPSPAIPSYPAGFSRQIRSAEG